MEDQEQYGLDRGEQMLVDLITAMQEQTKAINSLVESNQRLVMVLAESVADEDETASCYYMDGTPK